MEKWPGGEKYPVDSLIHQVLMCGKVENESSTKRRGESSPDESNDLSKEGSPSLLMIRLKHTSLMNLRILPIR